MGVEIQGGQDSKPHGPQRAAISSIDLLICLSHPDGNMFSQNYRHKKIMPVVVRKNVANLGVMYSTYLSRPLQQKLDSASYCRVYPWW